MNYQSSFNAFFRAAEPYLLHGDSRRKLYRSFERVRACLAIFVSREFYDYFEEEWKDRVFFCKSHIVDPSRPNKETSFYVALYITSDTNSYDACVEDTGITKTFQAWLEKRGFDDLHIKLGC